MCMHNGISHKETRQWKKGACLTKIMIVIRFGRKIVLGVTEKCLKDTTVTGHSQHKGKVLFNKLNLLLWGYQPSGPSETSWCNLSEFQQNFWYSFSQHPSRKEKFSTQQDKNITQWLMGHVQRVSVNGVTSSLKPITKRVQQAQLQGQFSFNIFINYLDVGLKCIHTK